MVHTRTGDSTTSLLCVLCKLSFLSAWELMVHAQAAHMINIYELGTRAPSPARSPSLDQPKESSPSPQDFQVSSPLGISFSFSLQLPFFLISCRKYYLLPELHHLRWRRAAIFCETVHFERKESTTFTYRKKAEGATKGVHDVSTRRSLFNADLHFVGEMWSRWSVVTRLCNFDTLRASMRFILYIARYFVPWLINIDLFLHFIIIRNYVAVLFTYTVNGSAVN